MFWKDNFSLLSIILYLEDNLTLTTMFISPI